VNRRIPDRTRGASRKEIGNRGSEERKTKQRPLRKEKLRSHGKESKLESRRDKQPLLCLHSENRTKLFASSVLLTLRSCQLKWSRVSSWLNRSSNFNDSRVQFRFSFQFFRTLWLSTRYQQTFVKRIVRSKSCRACLQTGINPSSLSRQKICRLLCVSAPCRRQRLHLTLQSVSWDPLSPNAIFNSGLSNPAGPNHEYYIRPSSSGTTPDSYVGEA